MGGGGVSYAAHVAGGFTGLFFGTFILRNYEKVNWEKVLMWVLLGVYAAAYVTVTVLSIMMIKINTFDEKSD